MMWEDCICVVKMPTSVGNKKFEKREGKIGKYAHLKTIWSLIYDQAMCSSETKTMNYEIMLSETI